MSKENDLISYEMWLSWHKINGDLISGPAPFRPNFDPEKHAGYKDDLEPRPKVYRHRRHHLHKMLTDQVERAGLTVEYGKKVLRYEEDTEHDKASVVLENGEKIEADVIVAADGIGNKEHRLTDHTHQNRGTSEESWSNVVSPEEVLQTTSSIDGWPELANRLIRNTRKDQIHNFKLMWRDPQPCWVSPGGRVVQVGDAAHTFLPSSGHGATQGMEDAVSLATCLRMAGKENIPWATRVHNKLRFERVSILQLLGVLNQQLRNKTAHADESQTKPIGILGSWIWRHDPEAYARENFFQAWAALRDDGGQGFENTNIPPGYTYQAWSIDEILAGKKRMEMEGDWD
ncbi:FAD NAD(P)-binding domain-containing [Lecanosticta acicola]|uniref:FAD NAD(P)-binding domain-containing n=1 Tax=Lecanosticta acicola TaxID=111012 RepID=A0AAI8W1A6_9PEZI|nr:FAD NAD(P)-binding domain-containing [Lecanosticta acicola]